MIRLAISADGHVSEPVDLWERELPARMRERGPRIAREGERTALLVEDQVVRRFSASFGHDAWGANDVAGRLKALERDGVYAEVVYPNLAFFCVFSIQDAALQVESCRVYNDWVADRFGDEPRIAPVGLLPVLDVDAAIAELQRLKSLRIGAGMLPTHVDARPYNDPGYERLWEAAAGLQVPLSFHVGTGRSQTPAHGPGGAVVNYVVTVSGAQETVSYLCGSGVLERHPDLRVAMVECGAGWLAWTLAAMDDAYRDHQAFVRPKLEHPPSFYFRRQGAVTFQRDPVGISNLPYTGVRCLLWGNDYPHPEGTYPESRAVLGAMLDGVPQGIVDRITFLNAAELYALPLPPDLSGNDSYR
jgi:predicted TIM-barrel fold metal-dependent hydrolase